MANTHTQIKSFVKYDENSCILGTPITVTTAILNCDINDSSSFVYHKYLGGNMFFITSWYSEQSEDSINAIFRVKLKKIVNK